MRKTDLWTIVFAAIVCVVCSLIISATSAALNDRQAFNVEIDRKLNVLKAFGVETVQDGRKLSGEEVQSIFDEHIEEIVVDGDTGEVLEGVTSADITDLERKTGEKLPLYRWVEDGEVTSYAFPLSGMGLWSTIYSYMALEDDLATIRGVTFYGHAETPGLGGEVSTDWFQQQFEGKKVYGDGSLKDFEVVKGEVDSKYPQGNDHAVDGISGATMTGNGVQDFINEGLEKYNVYFNKLRTS